MLKQFPEYTGRIAIDIKDGIFKQIEYPVKVKSYGEGRPKKGEIFDGKRVV